MKDEAKAVGIFTAAWFYIVLLVIAASLIGAYFYGVQQNLIRRAQTHTTGYVQAQVDQMSKNITQFDKNQVTIAQDEGQTSVLKALNAQQMGIVQDIWSAYDSIPQDAKDAIPTDILTFLNNHSRNWQP